MATLRLDPNDDSPLYAQVARGLETLVDRGTFRPGDRLPSIRALARQLGVGVNTVREAYALMEDRGVVEARPQSGFYVRPRLPEPLVESRVPDASLRPRPVDVRGIAERVMHDIADPALVQLGATVPDPDLLPVERLNRMTASALRRRGRECVAYTLPPGWAALRAEIAKRLVASGCAVSPDEIVITNGCVEAVVLALEAVCRPGDTVAVESPTYYTFLQILQEMGLNVLEVPATPRVGLSLEALELALDRTPVAACLVVPNFSNPAGACMPDGRKEALVRLCARYGVPLIEDDINGDLSFREPRPRVAKAFDRDGGVLLCSSFTKTLAPGYRIGWIAPGRFRGRVERRKLLTNLATATPPQIGLAEFLANGGYDRHLRRVRRAYADRVARMGAALAAHFPEGTRVSRPEGGFSLWVELPESVDSLDLYAEALDHGITIAPGPVFTASGKFRNFVRLSAAVWTEREAAAVATLGRLVRRLAG
ncbi:MAG: PLP-dependent aminotransferase family protein [Candidatus Dadabacteria bacterium]|nr:MAG: PLP-dependent aminotransferase family protein [Candidatus Dadabacteria bacterium]